MGIGEKLFLNALFRCEVRDIKIFFFKYWVSSVLKVINFFYVRYIDTEYFIEGYPFVNIALDPVPKSYSIKFKNRNICIPR